MATSPSRLSYTDAFDILDGAMANSKGVRVEVNDAGAGMHLRVRLHSARMIDRNDNKTEYPPGHKLYGRSIYDQLVCRVRKDDGKWWLYLERFSTASLNIQPLGEPDGFNQSTESDLGAAGGESLSQSREETSEAPTDVFDGEVERQAEPAEPVAEEGNPSIQARRKL